MTTTLHTHSMPVPRPSRIAVTVHHAQALDAAVREAKESKEKEAQVPPWRCGANFSWSIPHHRKLLFLSLLHPLGLPFTGPFGTALSMVFLDARVAQMPAPTMCHSCVAALVLHLSWLCSPDGKSGSGFGGRDRSFGLLVLTVHVDCAGLAQFSHRARCDGSDQD